MRDLWQEVLGSAALPLRACMKLQSRVYRETVRHSERKTWLGKACALRYRVTLQRNFGNSIQQDRPTRSSRATRCPRRRCGTRKRLVTLSLTNPRQNIEAGIKFNQKLFIYGDLQNVANSLRKNAFQMTTSWRKLQTAFLQVLPVIVVGRDSSVGIATRYGLDGLGIESRWGARFSAPVQNGRGSHPASCTIGTGSFSGGEAAEAWRWPPKPSQRRG